MYAGYQMQQPATDSKESRSLLVSPSLQSFFIYQFLLYFSLQSKKNSTKQYINPK